MPMNANMAETIAVADILIRVQSRGFAVGLNSYRMKPRNT
jgi:hypothetical protein